MKKKNQIVAFLIMTLISFASLVYANIKANEAEENAILFHEANLRADENEKIALDAAAEARRAMAEAVKNMEMAKQAMKDCEGN